MIEINELVMSLPDMTPEEGEKLANDVAVRLVTDLPIGFNCRSIDSLDVRLSVLHTTDHNKLADDIVTNIRYLLSNR